MGKEPEGEDTNRPSPNSGDGRSESARARVMRLFIEPLEARGLIRDRRQGRTMADHESLIVRLAERLSYLTDENLHILQEIAFQMADGPENNIWPSFNQIIAQARVLQEPPDPSEKLIRSWFHSAAGPDARDQGCVVELAEYMRKFRRPPNNFAKREILDTAYENRRDMAAIERAMNEGRATAEQIDRLRTYSKRREALLQIIVAGEAHRQSQVHPT